MDIQWYPGHMTKSRRMMSENISLVDIVIELLDARIPYSSKNPDIDELAKNKFRIIVLNKSDLSDDYSNEKWAEYFREKGFKVVLVNSVNGKGINDIIKVSRELMMEKLARFKARGRIFMPIRSMVVGIPNVGKSTFINKLVGKAMTKTGDKPGVTRGKQWIKVKKDFELMDTPGILWPKFEDQTVGLRLAITGAINDNILDAKDLAVSLITILRGKNPSCLKERYGIEFDDAMESWEILDLMADKRNFRLKGNEPDALRMSKILIDEFRGGKLGKISLELPGDI